MAKYSIAAVEPTKDGSGNIAWDVWALDDDGLVIPGRHKTVLTPYDEAQEAITGGGVLDKVKALLLKYAGPEWDNVTLDGMTAENLNAVTVDAEIDAVVASAGGYPFVFDL